MSGTSRLLYVSRMQAKSRRETVQGLEQLIFIHLQACTTPSFLAFYTWGLPENARSCGEFPGNTACGVNPSRFFFGASRVKLSEVVLSEVLDVPRVQHHFPILGLRADSSRPEDMSYPKRALPLGRDVVGSRGILDAAQDCHIPFFY